MAKGRIGKGLAHVYAEALYDAALETGVLPQIQEELLALQEVLQRAPRVRLFLDSPTVRFEEKCRVMEALSGLTQPGRNFIRILVKRQRIELLDQIVDAFHDHCNQKAGVAELDVGTARDLSADEKTRLTEVLERRMKRRVVLQVRVRPELLGGFVVTHRGRVYDASLSHYLGRLMEKVAATRSGLGFYKD
jgi:F-type H+-transporting ATPase subunit delta